MDTLGIDSTIAAVTAGSRDLTPVGKLALEVLRFQRGVLAGLPENGRAPDSGVVAGRLAAGNSALGFDDLHIDPEAYHGTWNKAVALFSTLGAITTEEASELLDEGESAERLMRLTEPWYDHGAYESISLRSDLTPETISVSVKPWLLAAARRVAPLLGQSSWTRPYCPACGGEPDLAILDPGKERSLLCSRCDTLWPWRRDGCPVCDDVDSPTTYHAGATPCYSLLVCEGCDRALKTVDTGQVGGEIVPAAERIFATELDHLAAGLNLTT